MRNKVISILEEVLDEKIDINSSQKNCENWDSLHHLNLILALESEFQVDFEPEEISIMKSYEMIIKTINKKI